jgi:POT family proton-dependent oligopeptide transporter
MKDRQPSSPAKFSIGLILVGLGTLVLALGSTLTGAGRVSPMWLVSMYFVQTTGEMCLSPVGLSTTTKLAPARIVGLMMGVWFLSISFGSKLAGWAAGFYKDDPGTMFRLFTTVGVVGIAAGLLLAALVPRIKKLTAHAH